MGMQRPSGIPVSNIMEVIFGNLSVLYVVKDLKQKYHLGSFKNIDAAVNAREEAENKLYADFLEWYAEEYPERWKRLKKRD